MFTKAEKQFLAAEFEKLVLGLNHPEMPKTKPVFRIHVEGSAAWSWADIEPNWVYEQKGSPENPNPWNEIAREQLTGQHKDKESQ